MTIPAILQQPIPVTPRPVTAQNSPWPQAVIATPHPVPGVRADRAGCRVVPLLPSRAPRAGCGPPGVGLQAGEDGVADLPFQRPQRLFGGLAFGQLLVVVGAALAVPVADLADCGHVDGMVETAVPAPGQPVDLSPAGGHLDRRGAVVGGEVVPARETGYVPDVADDGGCDDRPDPEQPGQAGPGRDSCPQAQFQAGARDGPGGLVPCTPAEADDPLLRSLRPVTRLVTPSLARKARNFVDLCIYASWWTNLRTQKC